MIVRYNGPLPPKGAIRTDPAEIKAAMAFGGKLEKIQSVSGFPRVSGRNSRATRQNP